MVRLPVYVSQVSKNKRFVPFKHSRYLVEVEPKRLTIQTHNQQRLAIQSLIKDDFTFAWSAGFIGLLCYNS
jgi:hypothetical protein